MMPRWAGIGKARQEGVNESLAPQDSPVLPAAPAGRCFFEEASLRVSLTGIDRINMLMIATRRERAKDAAVAAVPRDNLTGPTS